MVFRLEFGDESSQDAGAVGFKIQEAEHLVSREVRLNAGGAAGHGVLVGASASLTVEGSLGV
jgi:hypothetical protein